MCVFCVCVCVCIFLTYCLLQCWPKNVHLHSVCFFFALACGSGCWLLVVVFHKIITTQVLIFVYNSSAPCVSFVTVCLSRILLTVINYRVVTLVAYEIYTFLGTPFFEKSKWISLFVSLYIFIFFAFIPVLFFCSFFLV